MSYSVHLCVCVPEEAVLGVKGTDSWALSSCSLSFFMVRVLICSSSLLFSSCSWWRDFNMPTTERDMGKKLIDWSEYLSEVEYFLLPDKKQNNKTIKIIAGWGQHKHFKLKLQDTLTFWKATPSSRQHSMQLSDWLDRYTPRGGQRSRSATEQWPWWLCRLSIELKDNWASEEAEEEDDDTET